MELNNEKIRKPTDLELGLIKYLIDISEYDYNGNLGMDLLVSSMNDGNMGGLFLYTKDNIAQNRLFGKEISSFKFEDLDGIDVIVSLYLDTNNELYELDIWKTNYCELLHIPSFSN